jgi:hypothetical protein
MATGRSVIVDAWNERSPEGQHQVEDPATRKPTRDPWLSPPRDANGVPTSSMREAVPIAESDPLDDGLSASVEVNLIGRSVAAEPSTSMSTEESGFPGRFGRNASVRALIRSI